MTRGTKSVLFGAHCFFLHPFFVAWAWWRLYGFPWDPRLWVAFFVHDLGYIGKPNMDGEEGETHPVLGACIMSALFDLWPFTPPKNLLWVIEGPHTYGPDHEVYPGGVTPWFDPFGVPLGTWGQFCLLHSRYYAKRVGLPFSRLCVADKLAIALTPAWLYLPMVAITGELSEYMENGRRSTSANWVPIQDDRFAWYRQLQHYMRQWVDAHRDGGPDTWTEARYGEDKPSPSKELDSDV